MNRKIYRAHLVFGLISVSLFIAALQAQGAATIWTGPSISFTKSNFGNPSLAANQDRMTSDIWISRSSSQGLFNVFSEPGFTHYLSPSGTEWANGSLANYASLSYTDWNSWAKGINAGPSSTVGVNAVLHLIPDNVYLSIRFTSWTSGGAGGGFSYIRSTPAPVPEPSAGWLLLLGLAVFSIFGIGRIKTTQLRWS
jgi:hypothetical protein